jgi:hypothetical protein
MSDKYKINEVYTLRVFSEPEEMEYLGKIQNSKTNGADTSIVFEVFRRMSFGRLDLMALASNKFIARSYDGTIEGLLAEIRKGLTFFGSGHDSITVGDKKLQIGEFKAQVAGLLTDEQIEESVLRGRYDAINNGHGEVKWCPSCGRVSQTSCAACGCGNCKTCGHRWTCQTPFMQVVNLLSPFSKFFIDKSENQCNITAPRN